MTKFFETPLKKVKDGLQQVLDECPVKIHQVFVIGGFAESEYIYSEIIKVVKARGIAVAKPDDVLSKAIAHGALSWHLSSGVQLHIARLHYGAETDFLFDDKDPDMRTRNIFKNNLDQFRVRDGWSTIVAKARTQFHTSTLGICVNVFKGCQVTCRRRACGVVSSQF